MNALRFSRALSVTVAASAIWRSAAPAAAATAAMTGNDAAISVEFHVAQGVYINPSVAIAVGACYTFNQNLKRNAVCP